MLTGIIKASSDLTEYARAGFYGNANPHLYTSPCWYAHSLGAYLHATGRPIPTNGVRMSRGSSVRVGDIVYRHGESGWVRV